MASRNTKFIDLRVFNRGLVLNRPPVALEEGEAEEAENVDLEDNILKRRPGWTPLHTADLPSGAEAVNSLYPFYEQGKNPLLFAVAGTHLMTSEGGEFTSVTGSLATNAPVYASFVAANNALYIATRSGLAGDGGVVKKWTSIGGLTNLSTQNIRLVTTYGDSIWGAGSGANDSRLYWSKYFPSQDTWPANNFIDVQPGDGDKITGLAHMLNAFIIFKERSIHRITGQQPEDAAISSGDLQLISYAGQEGCIAPDSLASSNNLIVYLNRKGIFGYDGVRPQELTEPIAPLFEELNESELQNAAGHWVEPGHYLLSVARGGSPVPNLIISLRLFPERSITVWTGLRAHSIQSFRFGGQTRTVLGLAGKVAKLEGDTDNGTRIQWKYTTGALDFKSDPFHKVIRRGWLWAKPGSGTVNLEMLPDFKDRGPMVGLDTAVYAAAGEDIIRVRAPAFGTARHWQIRLSGQGNGPAPEVHEVMLEYFSRNRQ